MGINGRITEKKSKPVVTFEDFFSKEDLKDFLEGEHHTAYEIFGAHLCNVQGIEGCRFTVWAPRATAVHVVADFNQWNQTATPMYPIEDTGVFFAFVSGVVPYTHYKYCITTASGEILEKADPYAFFAQQPMNNASRVLSLDYCWKDPAPLRPAKETTFDQPMNIYEVHLGSWKRKPDGKVYTYREIAEPLLDYVTTMGYTHVEIMPITEYPLAMSWGYQVTGFFAPTSKFGEPQDFMYFVEQCHERGVGVILDWVPAHFPKDAWALARFDGLPLYEYVDSRIGEHRQWGTLVFDYGKKPVVNFLISSALFWAKIYRIDGFRVDAVSSMIYLNYMREDYFKNIHGGVENLEAVAFLRRLNTVMKKHHPHVLMIAEEATDWEGITAPIEEGGLGFDYKWNMGWMNDTLRYLKRPAHLRKYHHGELTFSLIYAFNERFILPLSHDEVVHGKRSLVEKMPGDHWQKFANLRLLYGYMYTHPGKKLLFMGGEFAQFIEWKYYEELEWFMLGYQRHQKMQEYVKALNAFYKDSPPLWECEGSWEGFQWLNADNSEQSVLSYLRYSKKKKEHLVVVCNFTPKTYEDFRVGLPSGDREYMEKFNSDHSLYGGSGVTNDVKFLPQDIPWDQQEHSLAFRLPPLACVILGPTGPKISPAKKRKSLSNQENLSRKKVAPPA